MTLATFGVSMPSSTRDKLDAMARDDNRARSNLIAHLAEQEYDRRQQPHTLIDEGVGYSVGGMPAEKMPALHRFPIAQLRGDETATEEA